MRGKRRIYSYSMAVVISLKLVFGPCGWHRYRRGATMQYKHKHNDTIETLPKLVMTKDVRHNLEAQLAAWPGDLKNTQ